MKKSELFYLVLLVFCVGVITSFFIEKDIQKSVIKNGIGFGSVLAMIISWDRSKSVIKALLHGLLGWVYIFYFVVVRYGEEEE